MRNVSDMVREMEEALAHHEREATRLRTMIAAANGQVTPPSAPAIVPMLIPPGITYPTAPSDVWHPATPWPHDGVYCGPSLTYA